MFCCCFFIWQGVERFYCGWSYIYGPCIQAISGRYPRAEQTRVVPSKINAAAFFFFFMHKVFQLVRLSVQTIVMFFHHLSCFLCAPLYTRRILSFVFFSLSAASLWFEVASRCRTALLWLESTSPSRSTQSTGTLSADKTGGKDAHRADVHKRWLYPFFPILHLSNPFVIGFCSFDLVTLGAMSVTLMFQRPPFLPQTRTIWTPNNNFLVLDQVTMSREEVQLPKCDIRSVLSPYPLVLPYPLPRYTASCVEKGPAVPELQVRNSFTIIKSRSMWRREAATRDGQRASRDSGCSSSIKAGWPRRTGFCKCCSIPVRTIQIRHEENANVFCIHILPDHAGKWGGWKVRCGGQTGDFIFTLWLPWYFSFCDLQFRSK